jgi:hypothetical protein
MRRGRIGMHAGVVKSLVLMIGGPVVLLLVGVAIFLVTDYVAYQRVEITTALMRDGMYDPARHFASIELALSRPNPVGPTTFFRNVDIASWMQ